MKLPKATPKSPESLKLSRDDWLDAAFLAVVDGGFDSVRVLVLADKLGVTRGSFYWHFADHAELIQALLTRWRDEELASGRNLASTLAGDPKDDIEKLLDFALAHAGNDLQNMRFELAMRGLGRRDAQVADMLAQIDAQRIGMFQHQFQRLTGDAVAAADLAVLFYLSIAGSFQALSRPSNPPEIEKYLKRVITHYLVHQQVAAP